MAKFKVGDVIKYTPKHFSPHLYIVAITATNQAVVLASEYKNLLPGHKWARYFDVNRFTNEDEYTKIGELNAFTRALHGVTLDSTCAAPKPDLE